MYNDRIIQVEKSSFTPLVFSTSGGMGKEAETLHKRLVKLISEKRGTPYGDTMSHARRKLRFSILRTTLAAIRRFRGRSTNWTDDVNSDINIIPDGFLILSIVGFQYHTVRPKWFSISSQCFSWLCDDVTFIFYTLCTHNAYNKNLVGRPSDDVYITVHIVCPVCRSSSESSNGCQCGSEDGESKLASDVRHGVAIGRAPFF